MMAAVRHLGIFKKFEISSAGPVRRANMRKRVKFRADRSNRCPDIASFWIFQDGGLPPSWII